MKADRGAKFLWDARHAADRVMRFTNGRSYDHYLGDEILRSAVERQLEIVGEALAGLRRVSPDMAASIPELPRVVAMRNVLIHGYATVDNALVWSAVHSYVPALLARVTQLLDHGTTSSPTSGPQS